MPKLPVTKKIFRCPHCSNEVPMQVIEEASGKNITYTGYNNFERTKALIMGGDMPPETKQFTEPEIFTIYKCPTCEDITILKKSYENITLNDLKEPDYVEKHQKVVYPILKVLDNNVIPLDICNIYEEAKPLIKLSPSSFGVQIRKALELLCEEQGAPKSGDIYNKLEKLSERNIFPENIIKMGNIIRKVAKYGAHPKDEEITASDADLLDDIFHLILDYVYITPYKVKQLQEKFEKVNK